MASHQPSTDAEDNFLPTLVDAVRDGKISLVQKLIKSGCDVTQRNSHDWSALTYALALGQWDIFQLLSKAYCLFDLKSRKKTGRLVTAVEEKALKKIVKLVGDGNFFKDLTRQERSAILFLAINHSCPPDVLAVLINDRSDITLRYHCGMTPLVLATVIGNHETLEAILSYKPDLYTPDDLRKSAVHYAIEKGCSVCLEILLKAGIKNKCALEKAMKLSIARGQGVCLLALLNWSKSCDLCSEDINFLICDAASAGSLECLEIMLDYGVDASWANSLGETAFMYAVIKGHIQCFDRLLQHNVKIDAIDFEGNTALMHAVQRKRPQCVSRLLDFGADVNVVNTSGMTAVSMACCQNEAEILQLIISSSSNVCVDLHGLAFKLAAKFCHIDALILLMENGIFLWRWMNEFNDVSPEPIAKAAVTSGTRPGHFCWQNQTMTLLKLAFYHDNHETVRFLLANHYLSDYDIRVLPRDEEFSSFVRKESHPLTVALLNQLTSQPWSLQTLSFLVISSAVNASSTETKLLWQQKGTIEQLPLPQKFITKLLFKCTMSELCVDQWERIGIQSQENEVSQQVNLLSNKAPMWKDFTLPEECEKGQCSNNAEGFRNRFQCLGYRKYVHH